MSKIRTAYKIYKQKGLAYLLLNIIRFIVFKTGINKILPSLSKPNKFGIVTAPVVSIAQAGELVFQNFNNEFVTVILPGTKNIFNKYTYRSTLFRYSHYHQRIGNIERRYFKHLDVDSSDIVIDVGPYVGLTTGVAAEKGSKVIALEPSPRNHKILKGNLSELDNVQVRNLAANNETGSVKFNIEGSGNTDDDSLLNPDSGKTEETVGVRGITIKKLMSESDITEVNFLKVEAEGAEPEVIEGIRDLEIDKIAVLCTPERDGKSPKSEVEKILTNKGYNIKEWDDEEETLYATF